MLFEYTGGGGYLNHTEDGVLFEYTGEGGTGGGVLLEYTGVT